jgi:hypothetical protein
MISSAATDPFRRMVGGSFRAAEGGAVSFDQESWQRSTHERS